MRVLRDIDAAERAYRIKALFWTVPIATLFSLGLAIFLRERDGISGTVVALIILGGVVTGIAGGAAVLWASGRLSEGLVQMLFGAGNLPPAPSFSLQESLVARGRHAEAAAAFRDHLAGNPGDHAARLALVPILAGALGDLDGAVATLLEVRRLAPDDAALDWRVSQELIDLHRRSGNRGRLMAELARFAHRQRGTAPGRAAREELLRLKADEGAGPEH